MEWKYHRQIRNSVFRSRSCFALFSFVWSSQRANYFWHLASSQKAWHFIPVLSVVPILWPTFMNHEATGKIRKDSEDYSSGQVVWKATPLRWDGSVWEPELGCLFNCFPQFISVGVGRYNRTQVSYATESVLFGARQKCLAEQNAHFHRSTVGEPSSLLLLYFTYLLERETENSSARNPIDLKACSTQLFQGAKACLCRKTNM